MADLLKKYIPSEVYRYFLGEFDDREQGRLKFELEEFLKFAILLSHAPVDQEWFIPVNRDIDLIWHAYILQTREYSRFCASLPGHRKFLHHRSLPYSEYRVNRSDEELQVEHAWWLASYVSTFGAFRKEISHYWTTVRYLSTRHGWSLSDINFFGLSLHKERGIGPHSY